MSLRFIIGRAGSGKTHFIFESIKKTISESPDGPPVIFLVPEQATFQMELDVAKALGGAVRAQVLSFRRLAHRVFLETGGAARIPIGELGKRMILRELLERNKANLRVFGKSAGRIGFADCLARTIGEFKTYLIT
ncbi:MAG TPA: helicase-exonuclease AddAB subunit AddB, partial [Desulfobacteria bacterium]|nr:helicase-exonuclease AddAB subunit AddB [Desulfobacteria bacterium]